MPLTLAGQFARQLAAASQADNISPPAGHGPAVILPNAATPAGRPNASGTVAGLLAGGTAPNGGPANPSPAGTARRRGQADPASQVPSKTPEIVPGAAPAAQPVSSVDPSVATAVSQPGLPTPAEQVAMRLVPLRRGPDGIHRLTIHLNPEDLGPISVVAEVRGGAIAVQLHSATEAGRAALQASLPDLRQSLIEGGFGSCALDLGSGEQSQTQSQGQSQPQPQWNRPEQREAPKSPAPIELPDKVTDSALDLRV